MPGAAWSSDREAWIGGADLMHSNLDLIAMHATRRRKARR